MSFAFKTDNDVRYGVAHKKITMKLISSATVAQRSLDFAQVPVALMSISTVFRGDSYSDLSRAHFLPPPALERDYSPKHTRFEHDASRVSNSDTGNTAYTWPGIWGRKTYNTVNPVVPYRETHVSPRFAD